MYSMFNVFPYISMLIMCTSYKYVHTIHIIHNTIIPFLLEFKP